MANPLRDCVIALSGKFEETHAKIGTLIKTNGGRHCTKVCDKDEGCLITHLITTAKHIESQAEKALVSITVQEASKFSDVKIVNFDWLTASIDSQKIADEDHFSFGRTDTSPNIAARLTAPQAPKKDDIKGKGRKRLRSPTPIEEDFSNADYSKSQTPKKHKDVQRASSGSLFIPVDETCPLAGTHRVCIGQDGVIFDAALNQTDVGGNNNKFYRIQILASGSGDYRTWTRWGRVGEIGAGATLGDGSLSNAMLMFEKKFKDKAGVTWSNRFDAPNGSRKKGYYTFIERRYEDESGDDDGDVADQDFESNDGSSNKSVSKPSQQEDSAHAKFVSRANSALPKSVQRLMELIFNQQYFADTMRELDYDADKLPLGKLSKRTLEKGFEILKDLGELLTDPSIADNKHNMTYLDAIMACTNDFYTIIPHAFGRSRPPVISTDEKLKKEISLMESLSDMQIANSIMRDTGEDPAVNALDRQFAGLGLREMTPLTTDSNEFKLLREYLIKSHGHTHHLAFKVQDIFRIERNGEDERFKQSPYARVIGSDRRLLWHGSRVTNYGGILSQGLRIAPPEAPVNGYAFGKGVYLADISSKSANYCQSQVSSSTGLLLLCEAELGKPMLELEVGRSDAAELAKQHGCIATWGRGATAPAGWKDAGCVHADLKGVMMPDTTREPGPANYGSSYLQYNEYIAYDIAQVRLRYLLRVEMR